MQTRKRARSVTFGKTTKEKKEEKVEEPKKEKIVVKEPEKISEKAIEKTTEKTAEKAEVVERRVVPEKPHVDELSSTLPHTEEKAEIEEVAASKEEHESEEPANDSVSGETLSSTVEASKEEEEEPKKTDIVSDNLSVPEPVVSEPSIETTAPAVTTPEQPAQQQELSSTLPPSAFTIQEGDTASASQYKPEEGKKKAGVYFFVIAFLAFILGLGAMAAISYFGLISPKIGNFSSNLHMPSFVAAKPTPTQMPTPTAAPTAKPVNLQAYTIAVLNGSGVTGAAGKIQSSLNTAGFKVASTGNADKSDYTKTEISAKKSVDPAYISKLEDELNKSYDVDSTVGTSEESSSSDVTVIIGTQTAQ